MLRHLLQPYAMTYINSHLEVFYKKRSKRFRKIHRKSCAEVFFSRKFNKNEHLAQVVSCEFCQIGLTSKYKNENVSKYFLGKYIYIYVLCIFKSNLLLHKKASLLKILQLFHNVIEDQKYY